jgi:DNA polymerase bacteriophage-type
MPKLHIDLETYSSVDLRTSGAYKYAESVDFEILLLAFAFDDGPVRVIDFTQGQVMPFELVAALQDPSVEKHAHNAAFERICLRAYGLNIPAEQWHCSAIKASYCGLPMSLADVSKALQLEEQGKDLSGKALIRYFTMPIKASKANGGRLRNFPEHDLEKWEAFKAYCAQDVEAERQVGQRLAAYTIPQKERELYALDQKINDAGIEIDTYFAQRCIDIDQEHAANLAEELKELTGLENPNSPTQLKQWLSEATGQEVTTIAKAKVEELLAEAASVTVQRVLELRTEAAKTSTKKYVAMIECAMYDSRARGLLQFYGAGRTGRWAGRLIQVQNLPQNHLPDLEVAREAYRSGTYSEVVRSTKGSVPSDLSQLIRTAFVAKEHHTFAVADFSAIEARVIAWLAGEEWRLEVFRTHGKIYEASAAAMFNVPIEEVTKGSDLRAKGKVAELALGFGGGAGALRAMGGEAMGLSDLELQELVNRWRAKNPAVVSLWKRVEAAALRTLKTRVTTSLPTYHSSLSFEYDGQALRITLHSGRELVYWSPKLGVSRFGHDCILYRGPDPNTKQWGWIDTYGGKLVENIVQATARDLLADAMLRVDQQLKMPIVMHVHDELVAEVLETQGEEALELLCAEMSKPIDWALGLPLAADGYITPFYKKD